MKNCISKRFTPLLPEILKIFKAEDDGRPTPVKDDNEKKHKINVAEAMCIRLPHAETNESEEKLNVFKGSSG